MRYVKSILVVVGACALSVVGGQQSNMSGKKRAVILPREVALPMFGRKIDPPGKLSRQGGKCPILSQHYGAGQKWTNL